MITWASAAANAPFVQKFFSEIIEPGVVLIEQRVGLIGDVLEVCALDLLLLLHLLLPVRMLLLGELHRVNCVRLVCFYVQDRQ